MRIRLRNSNLKLPSDNLSRSLIGFFVALLVGALIPRTTGLLIRRVLIPSAREIFVLALAGWLTDALSQTLLGSSKKTRQPSAP